MPIAMVCSVRCGFSSAMVTETEADRIVGEIAAAFESCGHLDYGETVNMREHMLQAAWLAEKDGVDDRLIVASLLHDYGHLVCNMPNDTFEAGIDNYHEEVGANALAAWFEEDIVNAVRLHVDAKRYLCAVNPKYLDKLSAASRVTLEVQGGPMQDDERQRFEQQSGYKLAIRVRIYDDLAKAPTSDRPDLEHYFPAIRACLT